MIRSFETPGMGANCYLVSGEKTKQAVLIDPGEGGKQILGWVRQYDVEVILIIITHAHFDHIGAVEDLRKELGVKVAVHEDDAEMLTSPRLNLSTFFGPGAVVSAAEILLKDNQELTVGEMKIKILHTPGHTPGGICLLTGQGLFSGDTLFDGSIGRTDFTGGNMDMLIKSIQEKLLVLDDELPVFPGHGPATTIGRERKLNPFLKGF